MQREHHPRIRELLYRDPGTRLGFRAPRKNSKGEYDSPEVNVMKGFGLITTGITMAIWAGLSSRRVQKEQKIIERMIQNKTTIANLR